MSEHKPAPLPDTAYTIGGPRDNHRVEERLPRSFPAEGICSCGEVVRRESQDAPWKHAGRMPGELG